MIVEAYTDGSCQGNPGPAGWAAVLSTGEEYSGFIGNGTNNIAELEAIFQVIARIDNQIELIIYTDSQLVIGWLQEDYAINMEHIRLRVSNIKNLIISKQINFKLKKVKAHADNHLNNRADKLAKNAIKKGLKQQLI